jgi:hypothetical protein
MTGYRAFPTFPNPKSLRRLSREEFDSLQKSELQRSAGIAPGHSGSVVSYVARGEGGYFVLQVELEGQPAVFVETICTVTPTWAKTPNTWCCAKRSVSPPHDLMFTAMRQMWTRLSICGRAV